MRARLVHLWEILNASYWFVPIVMVCLAVVLALGLERLDHHLARRNTGGHWFQAGGLEGARGLLSTTAASVITVAGVVFSITVATLSQASSQFGPRLLRNFMRDTGNQITLGTFSATFIYCMLVLRTLSAGESTLFVPHLSVSVAILLALASIAVLIYFIHHISLSLQPSIIVAAVATDLAQAIVTRFPAHMGHGGPPPPDADDTPDAPAEEREISSGVDGYVQAVDQAGLINLASRHDLLLRLTVRPGDYVLSGAPVAYVSPPERCTDRAAQEVGSLLIIGRRRTAEQDVEFALTQIAEVGVRALSAAVNDPYTATTAIDALGSSLLLIFRQERDRPHRYDKSGRLRVIAPRLSDHDLAAAAFSGIRHYSRGDPSVQRHLMKALAAIARQVRMPSQREAIRAQIDALAPQIERIPIDPDDRAQIMRHHAEGIAALDGHASSTSPHGPGR